MSIIQVTHTFSPNTKARSAEVNQNFSDVLDAIKGFHHDDEDGQKVTTSGIADNANIQNGQLADITASGKVHNSALIQLTQSGVISNSALPEHLGERIFDTVYFENYGFDIGVESGELAFTDPANGTKRLSELGGSKFGGDGSDGALSISSGTTTLDLSNEKFVEKNYTSISITGTGTLAFQNPHDNGTLIVLKSQGNVVLTSSNASIDASAMGAEAGTGAIGDTNNGQDGTDGTASLYRFGAEAPEGIGGVGSDGVGGATSKTTGGEQLTKTEFFSPITPVLKNIILSPGSGGGGGGAGAGLGGSGVGGDGANGGRGGGALYVECAGDLNFTGTITVAGEDGSDAPTTGSTGTKTGGGGGGGGSAGMCLILYTSQTATSGTIDASGGDGGDGGDRTGSTSFVKGGNGGSGGGQFGNGGQGAEGNGSVVRNGSGGSNGSGGGGGAGANSSSSSGGTGGSGGSTSTDSNLVRKNNDFV